MIGNIVAKLQSKKVFARGIHPSDSKRATRNCAIEAVPWPAEVVVPVQQHIGAPAETIVKPRQEVSRGEMIAKSGGFVSSPVHSGVNGTTGPGTTCFVASGRRSNAITIRTNPISDEELNAILAEYLSPSKNPRPADQIEPEEIVNAASDAGLVGMGGATFPTHVKLKVSPQKPIDTVILNGSECEPCLTADDRLMREAPELIVRGLLLGIRATGAPKGIIAIEDNKPEAIASMRDASKDYDNVEVAVCKAQYPMGGERQLIPAVLNRAVPTKGLPLDVGVIVMNVATSLSLAHAVDDSRPVTHRVLTLTGAVNKPGNFFAPIGMPVSHLIEYAGGLREDAAEVIMGGPMMGVSMPDISMPIIKGTSGLVVLTKNELRTKKETTCVRCGRCVDHCPIGLAPTKIAHAVMFRKIDLAEEYDLQACCECGCCAYVCPAGIPLVQYMKTGKAMAMKKKRS